jgi:hypothetical protein
MRRRRQTPVRQHFVTAGAALNAATQQLRRQSTTSLATLAFHEDELRSTLGNLFGHHFENESPANAGVAANNRAIAFAVSDRISKL